MSRPGVRRGAAALVGAALAVAGLAVLAWAPASGAGPRLVGGNLPIDPRATDPRDITANNSPSLARNPARSDNLAVANRVDSPRLGCALHVSFDGGGTWTPVAIPFPEGEEQPPRCFAPDLAFGPGGTLYVSFVTLKGAGNVPNALWLSVSDDGGRTLGLPRRIGGPLTFGPRVVADPERRGRLALVWLQVADTTRLGFASTANPVLVARSDDDGRSWDGPFPASSPSRARALAPSPAFGADGRLWVAYLDLGADVLDYSGAHQGVGGPPYRGPWALLLARSDDGGQNWAEATVDPGVVPPERIVVLFPPAPSLAIDRSRRRLYLAMADARAGDPDVYVWASADGRSFRPPVRVNHTPVADGTAQYLPALSVSPGGRVDVVYYDRRRDRANVLNDVSLQSSDDGARGFGPATQLTDRSVDSRIGFGAERGLPDLGSRLALVSSRSRALAVWADTRAGTVASGKQALTRAVAAFGGSRRWAQLGGGGALAVGLGVVAWVLGQAAVATRRVR